MREEHSQGKEQHVSSPNTRGAWHIQGIQQKPALPAQTEREQLKTKLETYVEARPSFLDSTQLKSTLTCFLLFLNKLVKQLLLIILECPQGSPSYLVKPPCLMVHTYSFLKIIYMILSSKKSILNIPSKQHFLKIKSMIYLKHF